MSIWHEITQGVPAVVHPGPGRFIAGGQPVRCPHCQAEEFIEGSALLSTVGMSFAHLNWATEKKVTNLMCDNCGLIQWFGAPPAEAVGVHDVNSERARTRTGLLGLSGAFTTGRDGAGAGSLLNGRPEDTFLGVKEPVQGGQIAAAEAIPATAGGNGR